MKGGKIWSTVVDYFLLLSAVIGVGFASGKEISVFFFGFGKMSLVGLVCFSLLYIYLFYVVAYVKKKLQLNTYNQFNAKIFGVLSKFCTLVMLVNFAITCAGMLAGADYLFETFFGVGYKIPSLILSLIALAFLRGGIEKIRVATNIIIPIMIAIIVINSIANITPENVHFDVCGQSGGMAIYYGLLFGVNNFVVALPVLFEIKLKSKGQLCAIITISVVILLNILVLASNNFLTDMPMFELSAKLGKSFYYIYFTTLVFALFSTLMICCYNMQTILCKQKTFFGSTMIVLFNLILSQVGYAFIVQYLYLVSGVLSGVFVRLLVIMIIINLIKLEHQQTCQKCNKKVFKKLKFQQPNLSIFDSVISCFLKSNLNNPYTGKSHVNKNKYFKIKNK